MDFDPQPKLVLIYRPRKDEMLKWPEWMWVNNLLKVITRRKSGTAGIWICDAQIRKPCRFLGLLDLIDYRLSVARSL